LAYVKSEECADEFLTMCDKTVKSFRISHRSQKGVSTCSRKQYNIQA
jgi:hypothetical protein